MLLILEVILTVVVWRRGWRWKALLPSAVGFLVAFWMGVACAASGLSQVEMHRMFVFSGFFIDLTVIGTLIWMANKRRETISSVSTRELETAAEATPHTAG